MGDITQQLTLTPSSLFFIASQAFALLKAALTELYRHYKPKSSSSFLPDFIRLAPQFCKSRQHSSFNSFTAPLENRGILFKRKMLTKRDLRWAYKLLTFYSGLLIIPVKFKPFILGEGEGQMRSEKSSIWRRIGFKIVQILTTCHFLFMSFRTLDYINETDVDGNLDFVPIMLILTVGYVTVEVIAYLIFVSGLELNSKVYNESLKIRGKK